MKIYLSYKNVLNILKGHIIPDIELYTNCSMMDKETGYVFCVFTNKILQFSQKLKLMSLNSVIIRY